MKFNKINKNSYGYLFIAPYFIAVIIIWLYPTLDTLYTSFHKWDGFTKMVPIGLQNYNDLIHDPLFYTSIWHTVRIWLTSGSVQLIVALILAATLNHRLMGRKHFFKASFFLPNIITAAYIGLMFLFLFGWQGGTVNQALMALGFIKEPVNWVSQGKYMFPMVSLILFFQWFGYHTILLDSGMTSISREIYEASEVDGANSVQTFFKITLPMLRPILIYSIATIIMGGFQTYDLPYILSDPTGSGEPQKSLLTMNLYMYNTSFKYSRFGYGAALGFSYCLVILVFTIFAMRTLASSESRVKE